VVNGESVEESFRNDYKSAAPRDILDEITQISNRNPDIVDSISVYYVNENSLISSTGGINNWSSGKVISSPLKEYIDRAAAVSEKSFWENVTDTSYASVIRFYKAAPSNSLLNFARAIIVIDIKSGYIVNLLKNYTADGGCMFIINGAGEIVVSTDEKYMNNNKNINWKDIENNSVFISADGEKTLYNCQVIEKSGWKFASASSVNKLYNATSAIGNFFILLAVITVLIGILIAYLFTRNTYKPIKNIISYNQPIMIYNIVNGLFRNTISSLEVLEERSRLLGFKNKISDAKFMRAVLFRINGEVIDNISVENSEYIIFNIVREIENQAKNNEIYMSSRLSDCDIGVALFSENENDISTKSFISDITRYIIDNFAAPPHVFVGGWVNSPLNLYKSYQDIKLTEKYTYFFPSKIIFFADEFKAAENSDEEFPENLSRKFDACLKNNDIDGIEMTINEFQSLINTKKYSEKKCHAGLNALISLLSNHIRLLNIGNDALKSIYRLSEFDKIRNITQCREWIYNIVDNLNSYLKSKKDGIQTGAVKKVIQYIDAHWGEDISIDFLADMAAFSPSYLSRMFKEVTGSTIVEYITLKRMEKAREYILNDNGLTVEQIGKITGFNSPAYFVKKFRETYGTSPKNYKQINKGGAL
jgi:AraC-like DNA-binding protein